MTAYSKRNTATLLIQCDDREGILASICSFIAKHHGNILSLQEHVEPLQQRFFARVEWDIHDFLLKEKSEFLQKFHEKVADPFQMDISYHLSREKIKVAAFVSKYSHCLEDLLYRYSSGELNIEIPVIISNHKNLREIAERNKIEFIYLPITKSNKKEQEKKQLELLEKYEIQLVVLARYMQILSEEFTNFYKNRIINIHHSFLPAFVGARPYHAAYKRGVKIIGATAHFVTSDLDEGPIICQNVTEITHRDQVEDMIIKGRDIEKIMFSKAIKLYSDHKVLAWNRRTVVFS